MHVCLTYHDWHYFYVGNSTKHWILLRASFLWLPAGHITATFFNRPPKDARYGLIKSILSLDKHRSQHNLPIQTHTLQQWLLYKENPSVSILVPPTRASVFGRTTVWRLLPTIRVSENTFVCSSRMAALQSLCFKIIY